jgi:hypothetical protein
VINNQKEDITWIQDYKPSLNYTTLPLPTSKLSSHCWMIYILDINPRHDGGKALARALIFTFAKHVFTDKRMFFILRIE